MSVSAIHYVSNSRQTQSSEASRKISLHSAVITVGRCSTSIQSDSVRLIRRRLSRSGQGMDQAFDIIHVVEHGRRNSQVMRRDRHCYVRCLEFVVQFPGVAGVSE